MNKLARACPGKHPQAKRQAVMLTAEPSISHDIGCLNDGVSTIVCDFHALRCGTHPAQKNFRDRSIAAIPEVRHG